MPDNSALVRRFVDAYNRGDAEAIAALVTPDVERRGLHGPWRQGGALAAAA